jgi:elongation factor P
MKISGVDIRPGNIIEYEGGIWRAVKIQHTQPGKGGAYMQVEMKNLIDGRKTNVRFRSAETVERVRLDTKDYQYLYHDGDMLVFSRTRTARQVSTRRGPAGELPPYAGRRKGEARHYNERPISVESGNGKQRSSGRRGGEGQTASSSYKPAVLTTALEGVGSAAYHSWNADRRRRLQPGICRRADWAMVAHSGLITVMTRAARKAAPRLRRDFGEVEQLQVSRKGPADFSMADKRAERTIVEELLRGPIESCFEESGRSRDPDSRAGSSILGWDDQLSTRRAALLHLNRGRGRKPGGGTEITQGLVYQPLTDEGFWAEKGGRVASGCAPSRFCSARACGQSSAPVSPL